MVVTAPAAVISFEKMLYVNAQLIEAYMNAALVGNDPFYAEVAIGIVEYVSSCYLTTWPPPSPP